MEPEPSAYEAIINSDNMEIESNQHNKVKEAPQTFTSNLTRDPLDVLKKQQEVTHERVMKMSKQLSEITTAWPQVMASIEELSKRISSLERNNGGTGTVNDRLSHVETEVAFNESSLSGLVTDFNQLKRLFQNIAGQLNNNGVVINIEPEKLQPTNFTRYEDAERPRNRHDNRANNNNDNRANNNKPNEPERKGHHNDQENCIIS